MFKNKIAVITGGAQGIGRCIADEFRKQGASVCIIDRQPNEYFVGDISSEQVLRDFAGKVIAEYGRIDYLINNAIPLSKGLNACTHMTNSTTPSGSALPRPSSSRSFSCPTSAKGRPS